MATFSGARPGGRRARGALLAVVVVLVAACGVGESPDEVATGEQARRQAAQQPSARPPTVAGPRPSHRAIRVVAVGDIMLDGSAREFFADRGYGRAFARLRHLIAGADVAIGNLEGPLTELQVPFVPKQYVFRSPPGPVARALAQAGFDALSLANNHSLDFGLLGLRHTRQALRDAGVAGFGAGRDSAAARAPVLLERGGKRIGLLGYSNTLPEAFWAGEGRGGTAFGDESHVREDVARLAARADIVIVSFHWGREGTRELRPYQTRLARAAVDAGADLVVGHHPHVLQAVETYRGGLILYSLGNFNFGSFSPSADVSVVASVEFSEGRAPALEMTPINVNNLEIHFEPRVLAPERARTVFTRVRDLSREFGTELAWRGGAIVGGDAKARTAWLQVREP